MNLKTILATLVVLLVFGVVLLIGCSGDKTAKACPASQVIQASAYAENGCPVKECQSKEISGACSLGSEKTCVAAENKTEGLNSGCEKEKSGCQVKTDKACSSKK